MNMAFQREAFAACRFSEAFVGGNQGTFDGSKVGLLGDDTEFCVRLSRETGRCILYNPAVRVLHKVYEHRLTPRFIRRRAFWEGYTKATLVKLLCEEGTAPMKLAIEHALLRRILLRFFPRAIAEVVLHPAVGWRRLSLGIGVLFHVALGYGAGRFPGLGRFLISRYSD
jgi:GT2 family glycosyltransferase